MKEEEIQSNLENKALDILIVNDIYDEYRGNKEIEAMIAMNLSLRTSVYNKELEKSATIVELLRNLSESVSMEARWAVAKNPHTPLEILEKLSGDSINLVRALVATNPHTSTKILDRFFSDEKIVRDGLSGNPNTSPKLLKILSDDRDKMVRLRVAENPSTTNEILEKLSKDTNSDVSIASKKRLES